MNNIVLVTGGSKSGKSNFALNLTAGFQNKVFIATAEAVDDEMQDRIERHQKERGTDFLTIEEPLEIAKAIQSVPSNIEVILLDCVTVWMANLYYKIKETDKFEQKIQDFIRVLQHPPCEIIVVTNEVGMGIVPENKLARQFRDSAGMLNQKVAHMANRVVLLVSGIPVTIKGKNK